MENLQVCSGGRVAQGVATVVRLDGDVTGCRWWGLISNVAGGVAGSVAPSVVRRGVAGGCRQGCLWGPDRGCVSLEGAVERKVQII